MSIDLSVCIIAYHNFDDIRVAISSLEKYTSNKIRKQIYILSTMVVRMRLKMKKKK